MPTPRVVSRACLSLALLAGLTATAYAQAPQITAVMPNMGSPGSVVLVLGSGFAARSAPKLSLEFPGEGLDVERYRMRVLEWSDTEIQAMVLSGQAGSGQLVVRVHGQEPVSAAFKMLMPAVAGFSPMSAAPGDLVTVFGSSFGTRRGDVMLFERPCRVVDWSPGSATFKVPSNVPTGSWTPRVVTSIGQASAFSALSVSGSSAELPAPFLRMMADGEVFAAQGAGVGAMDHVSKVSFEAWDPLRNVDRHLSVVVPFALATGKVPRVFSGKLAGTQPMLFEMRPQDDPAALPSVYAAMPGMLPWKVHLLGSSQGRLFGQLSGVLQRVSGPGPETVELEQGEFLVDP